MLLCDIGNTSYHFFDAKNFYKRDVKSFDPKTLKEEVYFICVNAKIKEQLGLLKNWIDLSQFISKDKYYATMGVDRIFALEAVESGVIVDAGSAITVDVVKDGVFMGGFISPGVNAMREAYKGISDALAYEFNFELNVTTLPKNSQDAISYGFLKTLYCEVTSYDLPIILTGGDALKLKKIFENASVDEALIFKGMQKLIDTLE
jgi:type III pantothenate kinase